MKTTRRTFLKYSGGAALALAAPAIYTRPLSAQSNKRIAMIVKNLGNSYFDACANGAKEAAAELGGIEIIYTVVMLIPGPGLHHRAPSCVGEVLRWESTGSTTRTTPR